MDREDFIGLYESYMGVYDEDKLEEGYIPFSRNPNATGYLQITTSPSYKAGYKQTGLAMQMDPELGGDDGPEIQARHRRLTHGIAMGRAREKFERSKKKPKTLNASYDYDLYDLVLEYLLDEGLCESVENAEVMMAHMSEGWVESIVERTRYAKETGKSFTSGRTSERGGLKNQSGDVRKAALLHVMKNPPSGAGVRMGASGQPIPGGGSGSRQSKKERGAKVKETPKRYVTSAQKAEMRKRAEDNIGSRFD